MHDIVFHGSAESGLTEIATSEKTVNGKKQQIIFASPSMRFASCFLPEWKDTWCNLFALNDDAVYFSTRDREKFLQHAAKPASMYLMQAGDFAHDPITGKDPIEWISRKNCIPLFEIRVESCLEAMRKLGVQFHFVDEKIFEQMRNSEAEEKFALLEKAEKF